MMECVYKHTPSLYWLQTIRFYSATASLLTFCSTSNVHVQLRLLQLQQLLQLTVLVCRGVLCQCAHFTTPSPPTLLQDCVKVYPSLMTVDGLVTWTGKSYHISLSPALQTVQITVLGWEKPSLPFLFFFVNICFYKSTADWTFWFAWVFEVYS